MISYSWLCSLQFKVLFENGLYFELAKNAVEYAQYLQTELKKKDVSFLLDSSTNQIFPIVSNVQMEKLAKDFKFEIASLVLIPTTSLTVAYLLSP